MRALWSLRACSDLRLWRLDQLGGVVAEFLYSSGDLLIRFPAHLWCTAQNPKISPAWFTNDGIAVVGRKVDDPVLAVKRFEEGELQLGVGPLILDLGRTVRRLGRSVGSAAGVHNRYFAVLAWGVLGSDVANIFFLLKPVWISRYLVPFADVTTAVSSLKPPQRNSLAIRSTNSWAGFFSSSNSGAYPGAICGGSWRTRLRHMQDSNQDGLVPK